MSGKYLLLVGAALAVVTLTAAQVAPTCSDDIRDNVCKLPTCRCSGQRIPGLEDNPGTINGTKANIPQIVILSFDDAVTIDNFPFYQEVISPRKNPNGAFIGATFFVTHEYTNYSMVNELWRQGHEIALHSITHRANTSYWANLDVAGWRNEIVSQREQLVTFARIPATDMVGARAPFLQGGGNNMYSALQAAQFKWDCSRPTLSFRDPGLWPYTGDYASTQDCQIPPCPTAEFKGFWTVPMIDWIGGDNEGCAMSDTCLPLPETEDEMYQLLLRNFNDHYTGNKAPFGIFTHHGWINGTEDPFIWQRRLGYIKFLDFLDTKDDVYIVTVSQALEWIKTPTPLANLTNFAPWKNPVRQNTCPTLYTCRYPPELSDPEIPTERYMYSCTPCTPWYPWVGNHLGRPPTP